MTASDDHHRRRIPKRLDCDVPRRGTPGSHAVPIQLTQGCCQHRISQCSPGNQSCELDGSGLVTTAREHAEAIVYVQHTTFYPVLGKEKDLLGHLEQWAKGIQARDGLVTGQGER